MAMTLSPRLTVPLSMVMLLFAFAILSPRSKVEYVGDRAVFRALRKHDGETFLSRRVEQAFVHYSLLHALPAAIWSLVMPLQYWDSLRKKKPRLHRFCGYTAFACSLILSITGIAFIPFDLSWSNPMFTMHRIYGYPLVPSFNLALVTIAFPAMMITGFRALYLARNKRFAEHRRWTTYHGISGYLISVERVFIIVIFIFGTILDSSKKLQKALGSNRIKTIVQKSDAERAAFSATTWVAAILCVVWLWYVRREGSVTTSKNLTKTKIKAA